MKEKFSTKHPTGKRGVNIDKEKYETIRSAILESLQSGQSLTYDQMKNAIEAKLGGNFQGSIPWYVEVVKLDLEARGIIERISRSGGDRYVVSETRKEEDAD